MLSLGEGMASQTDQSHTPRLVWGGGPQDASDLHSVQHLDRILGDLQERASSGKPLIVELIVSESGTLAMGLGREETVLSFTPSSLDPPYLQSIGPNSVGGDLVFYYHGEWTDFPRQNAIALHEGREAMRRFFRERKPPDNVRWMET